MADYRSYVVMSLELHLFFARIMKEHALFLRTGLSPVDASFAKEAELYQQQFEQLLWDTLLCSDGIVSRKVLCSGEIVTEFTACAEQQTKKLTGICINEEITAREACLQGSGKIPISADMYRHVKLLNQNAIRLLDGLIALKETILKKVLCCSMFTMNYPLLLEHIIREAKLYRSFVCSLENEAAFTYQSMKEVEQFWNQIMMEHALFIRGLLDPTENDLIETSDSFAKDYARLLTDCREACDRTIRRDTSASLEETLKFRDFKAAGTKGIAECKIRSIILPLLADHVLREANHYIRLLSH